MTKANVRLGVLAAGAVTLFGLTLRARALGVARTESSSERTALAATQADLRELAMLRTQREIVATQKRPTQDVLAQVNQALRDAGIPTDRLKSLDPEADVPVGGPYRSQTLRLTLDRLTLSEIGALLDDWRARASVWTPTSIELAHETATEARTDLFDLRLVLAATYLSDAPEEPRR